MKVRMFVEMEYDEYHKHTEEEKTWFFDEILGDKEGLILHSNELGDAVGHVTVLDYHVVEEFTCKYCGARSEFDPVDQTPPPDYCHPEDHRSIY